MTSIPSGVSQWRGAAGVGGGGAENAIEAKLGIELINRSFEGGLAFDARPTKSPRERGDGVAAGEDEVVDARVAQRRFARPRLAR